MQRNKNYGYATQSVFPMNNALEAEVDALAVTDGNRVIFTNLLLTVVIYCQIKVKMLFPYIPLDNAKNSLVYFYREIS